MATNEKSKTSTWTVPGAFAVALSSLIVVPIGTALAVPLLIISAFASFAGYTPSPSTTVGKFWRARMTSINALKTLVAPIKPIDFEGKITPVTVLAERVAKNHSNIEFRIGGPHDEDPYTNIAKVQSIWFLPAIAFSQTRSYVWHKTIPEIRKSIKFERLATTWKQWDEVAEKFREGNYGVGTLFTIVQTLEQVIIPVVKALEVIFKAISMLILALVDIVILAPLTFTFNLIAKGADLSLGGMAMLYYENSDEPNKYHTKEDLEARRGTSISFDEVDVRTIIPSQKRDEIIRSESLKPAEDKVANTKGESPISPLLRPNDSDGENEPARGNKG